MFQLKRIFISISLLFFLYSLSLAQPVPQSTRQAHSHNDYEQPAPLLLAWHHGFGSVETDIFLHNDELLVAHDRRQLAEHRTLDSLYIRPLLGFIRKNKGHVYPDSTRHLQWMIDIKTAAEPTLEKLVLQLRQYPELVQCRSLKIVISGNRPPDLSSDRWPAWLFFDGVLSHNYSAGELKRIAMLSDDFSRYSKWNGKGRMTEKELDAVRNGILRAHEQGKPVRFWNAPDQLNAWYTFLQLGVDYINTDHIEKLSDFFKDLPRRQYIHPEAHLVHPLTYSHDATNRQPRNIIILIGDGTALPQWYAGYTANRGALHVFQARSTGTSKTSSSDHYITDSAPGATAISGGTKTRNRSVGVDSSGQALTLLTDLAASKGLRTGIITNGDLRDATPASFYAHNTERSDYNGILDDMLRSNVDLFMGGLGGPLTAGQENRLKGRFDIFNSVSSLPARLSGSLLLVDTLAHKSIRDGRGPWLRNAFRQAAELLSQGNNGFLLVLEAAQIDHGGHANDLPYLVQELLDFDQVIGDAFALAEKNGETLVIVTGDHETGGLTLTGGDYGEGRISGQFSTDDHTALPVPVFAFGPRSYLFTGVFENNELFQRIKKALEIDDR